MMGSDAYQPWEELNSNKGNVAMGIGDNCHITNAILDKNCRVGNNVVLEGGLHLEEKETDEIFIKEGIIVVKKGAILPDGFTVKG